MKNNLSVLILAAMLVQLSACGGEAAPSGSDTTTEAGTDTTTASAEAAYTRENYPDSLPKDLDFGGKTVRLLSRGGESYKNFEMGGAEENGDIVSDALYARNRAVEEQLNVELDIIYGDTDNSGYSTSYYSTVMAGDDAYDIIQAVHARGINYSHEGIFCNLIDAPYLDYEKPWWNEAYMAEISVGPTQRFLLQGDISLFSLRNLSTMFYNKTMYESLYGDGDGLYEIVVDGKWTHDQLRKMCADAYQDVNGNGEVEFTDILGCSAGTATKSDHYSYTAGMRMNSRDADGYPVLLADQSRNVEVIESLSKVYFETKGFYWDSSTTEAQGWQKFAEGTMLFHGERLYIAESLRDMKDPYGVIPYPKLNEEQKDYIALVHNSASLYGVPITLPEIDMACAVLEAMCAHSYRKVTPAYYDVALKVKYAQDEESGQVIDIIRGAMMTDFCYANSASLSSFGTLARTLLTAPDPNYMSHYDSIKTTVSEQLAAMIAKAKDA